jgi:type IV pilus assembly protein PilA
MKIRKRKEQGFTLVEVMLVVAIIGILANIAIPYMRSFVSQSFDTTAKSDVTNIIKATTAMISLGEGGTFNLVGDTVSSDETSNIFTLSSGVAGTVAGFSGEVPEDSWLLVQLNHSRGSKTYTYVFDGATGATSFTES